MSDVSFFRWVRDGVYKFSFELRKWVLDFLFSIMFTKLAIFQVLERQCRITWKRLRITLLPTRYFLWQSALSITLQTPFIFIFRQRIGDGKFLQERLSSTELIYLRQGTICSTRQCILSILACEDPGCLCDYLHYHIVPGNTPEPNIASTTGPKGASGHSWNAFRWPSLLRRTVCDS